MTIAVNVMSLTMTDGWQRWRRSSFPQPERAVACCSYYVIVTTTNLLNRKKRCAWKGRGRRKQFKSILEGVNINGPCSHDNSIDAINVVRLEFVRPWERTLLSSLSLIATPSILTVGYQHFRGILRASLFSSVKMATEPFDGNLVKLITLCRFINQKATICISKLSHKLADS